MSKLSSALKALIEAPFARAGTTPAPPGIRSVFERIGRHAESKKVEQPTWLAMTTAATVTLNSPESLITLHGMASGNDIKNAVKNAEMMREVGLKCIGFNGVPRTINCLNAFRASLPEPVGKGLTTKSSRTPTSANIEATKQRGRQLWNSIYRPFEDKLLEKLAVAHPDLPIHIVNSEYGLLFSDPPGRDAPPGQAVGRIATSAVAVAALRAQTGVGPQVISHIFGLRKALDDGSWEDNTQNEEGARWLASDEGGIWILESVDEIVEAIGKGQGSTFATPRASKL
ncbi:hypothetical protein NA57DRAFT_47819 [Rhizodiscina lignyota]|uniref:Dol-P-Man:Man(5)GlcNAc(2)-PP-Dol alpha-1,3-mannosyltransferase n=1 Tax=Rhizodiscina lignyota TaxID=1504668 RepID=A0A9P4M1H5_9PEZI|nr:hypothetical protein NA57DRAFT_47819 [Rhizodiscina lignyota]